MSDDLFEDLRHEVGRLVELKGKDNWSDTRNPKNFNLIQRTYSFGTRNCYEKKIKDDPIYTDLQSSRGLTILEEDSLERVLSQIDETMKISDADRVRFEEIESIFSAITSSDDNSSFKELNLSDINHTGFAELGFRIPKLMKHYESLYNVKVWGYDISPLSIGVTKNLGFDARHYDFDSCEKDLDLKGASLVVSYHMLEHLSDPLKAIKKIYDSMDSGSFFHVEIPIEPGLPRLRFAHMFPFEPNDMGHFLAQSGFTVLTVSSKTHPGGPHIERYMAMKR